MATAVHVPVEVYLRTLDYEPDCEYVDGVIEERPQGEYDHASWQQAIQCGFRSMPSSGTCGYVRSTGCG